MLHSYFIQSAEPCDCGFGRRTAGVMKILSSLPPDLSLPILIAQQIVPSFIEAWPTG